MLRIGIVGLPNVGKSTLFNALTSAGVLAANYPFATKDPNVGRVSVPDARLGVLTDIVEPQRTVPAAVEFVDIAGLVKGASQGEGLGNQFLANIRETDAIVHVVRCFDDDDVLHVMGSVDAVRDREVIEFELALADLSTVEKRLDRVRRAAKTGDKEALAELPEEDRAEFLASLGLTSAGLDRLIQAGFQLLGLQTYFTAGEQEVRAWTIHRGDTAPKAAAVIHTDFERGFIRAETVGYDDFVGQRGWKGAREKGAVRSEGKEDVVRDGGVLLFRFNV